MFYTLLAVFVGKIFILLLAILLSYWGSLWTTFYRGSGELGNGFLCLTLNFFYRANFFCWYITHVFLPFFFFFYRYVPKQQYCSPHRRRFSRVSMQVSFFHIRLINPKVHSADEDTSKMAREREIVKQQNSNIFPISFSESTYDSDGHFNKTKHRTDNKIYMEKISKSITPLYCPLIVSLPN